MAISELATAGIVAGAEAALGTAGSAAVAAVNSKKSYKYTKKLMELQNEINRANWHEQAAYNSIGAQMARLRAAGLNTNLIYGAGADGGIASAAPEVSTTPMEYHMQDPNLGAAINSGLSVYRAAADLENTEARTELVKQQTFTEMYKAAIAAKDYEYADAIRNASIRLMSSQADKNLSDIEVNKQTIEKIAADVEFAKLVNTWYPSLSMQNIKESESRIALNAKQQRELDSKIRLNNKTVSRMDVEIEKLRKEIEWVSSQTDLTDAEFIESRKRCERYDAEIRKLGKEADFTDKEIEYYAWNHSKVVTHSDTEKYGPFSTTKSDSDIVSPDGDLVTTPKGSRRRMNK